MNIVKPEVFLIGETKLNEGEIQKYLDAINAPEWTSDANSDSEKLIEIAGRMCYKSFKPGLNPNVTKIREGNQQYLSNVIKQGHLSIFEHAYVNFIFHNVSRVLCMELIRHRVGVSISQESLRYVRLDNISAYCPLSLSESQDGLTIFYRTLEELEKIQKDLADIYDIDNQTNFKTKKHLTSAFRRIAPMGLATSMCWGCNLRELRHIITLRTNPAAEEEIRLLFGMVYDKVKSKYPNVFDDFIETVEDDMRWIRPYNI